MAPLKNTKEIQRLTGRVASLNRFVSKVVERCLPFFDVLKKSSKFEWTMECQQAFDQLKVYLASPPLLVNPSNTKEIIVYLHVFKHALSAMLVKEKGEN